MSQSQRTRPVSYFALVMITVMMVLGLRNLPLLALNRGYYLYLLLIGAVVFLIPIAWITAELSSIWNEHGDFYLWIKKAFGPKAAFLAVWFKWAQSVVLYPLLLSFLAGTLAFIVAPNSASNKYYIVIMIWLLFAVATFLTYHDVKVSAWFTIYSVVVGVIVPLLGLSILAIFWWADGFWIHYHPFTHQHWLHISNPHTLVGFITVFMAYSGIEISASCVSKCKERQQLIPKVLFWGCVITITVTMLGTLACGFVLPNYYDTSAFTGIMRAIENYFKAFHLIWLTPVFALFIVLGVVGSLGNWMLTAPRALLSSAKDGGLPPFLQRENKHGAPVNLLVLQLIAVIIISCVFLYTPTPSGGFWLLTIVAVQLSLSAYLFLFAAAIRIRYKFPFAKPRVRVWGGKIGMWLVAGLGIMSSSMVLVLTFYTPYGFVIQNYFAYYFTIIAAPVVFISAGLILLSRRKAHWKLYADVKALSRF